MNTAPALWWSQWGSQGGWTRSHERGSLGLSRKPSRREQNRIQRWLGGSKLARAGLIDWGFGQSGNLTVQRKWEEHGRKEPKADYYEDLRSERGEIMW